MTWCGTAWCNFCKQVVDVENEDGFKCCFCGKPIKKLSEFISHDTGFSPEYIEEVLDGV